MEWYYWVIGIETAIVAFFLRREFERHDQRQNTLRDIERSIHNLVILTQSLLDRVAKLEQRADKESAC